MEPVKLLICIPAPLADASSKQWEMIRQRKLSPKIGSLSRGHTSAIAAPTTSVMMGIHAEVQGFAGSLAMLRHEDRTRYKKYETIKHFLRFDISPQICTLTIQSKLTHNQAIIDEKFPFLINFLKGLPPNKPKHAFKCAV